jgi:hypothetical protein
MTEAEWLACTDPGRMLAYLRGRASQRKLRLFACACVHRIAHLVSDPRSRAALEIGELHADGLAEQGELTTARREAEAALESAVEWERRERSSVPFAQLPGSLAAEVEAARAVTWLVRTGDLEEAVNEVASFASLAASFMVGAGQETINEILNPGRFSQVRKQEQQRQCDLLRDLFGKLFWRGPAKAAWLRKKGSTAAKVARAIYEERRFQDLPVLGDALEDAGCNDTAILDHCRATAPAGADASTMVGHVRGCWVVDLLRSAD